MPKSLRQSLLLETLITWLLSARFLHQHGKITVIVAYGPTEISEETEQHLFSDTLRNLIQDVPPHDITIVLTDFNATISAEVCDPQQPITGPIFIDPFTNDNGNRSEPFAGRNLCISDTWFPRKQIHHWTWYSPDGATRKATTIFLISQRWRSFITNCRVYRGAEIGNTDHRLLIADMKLKLKANPSNKFQPRLNSAKLADPVIQTSYQCSISNRFNALANDNSDNWQHFKQEVCKAAEETIGRTRPSPKQPWISMETLKIIDLRREARLRGDTNGHVSMVCAMQPSAETVKYLGWDNPPC
ncbi:craniofacial development protein 2-like [Penaeus japonicus]|uniref:craniofacial development protein 2-like n=1 Tax=Penaeus japonicus TaxID=27405 RepID=UPI001C716EBA|nr:craniofacial development protein 2-like [Penaeus japonicus]